MKPLLEVFRAVSFVVAFLAVGIFLGDLLERRYPGFTELGFLAAFVFVVCGLGYAHAYLVRLEAERCSNCDWYRPTLCYACQQEMDEKRAKPEPGAPV